MQIDERIRTTKNQKERDIRLKPSGLIKKRRKHKHTSHQTYYSTYNLSNIKQQQSKSNQHKRALSDSQNRLIFMQRNLPFKASPRSFKRNTGFL